ncbi:hypothetical protein ZWY2020_006868 [Hordeum vulgare]|nr:hypothetical protein ZWY2020_006868 [Hordeum vulgare]
MVDMAARGRLELTVTTIFILSLFVSCVASRAVPSAFALNSNASPPPVPTKDNSMDSLIAGGHGLKTQKEEKAIIFTPKAPTTCFFRPARPAAC